MGLPCVSEAAHSLSDLDEWQPVYRLFTCFACKASLATSHMLQSTTIIGVTAKDYQWPLNRLLNGPIPGPFSVYSNNSTTNKCEKSI